MALLREQESVTAIKHETTYGTDPTVAAGDLIEVEAGTTVPSYDPETQERNVLRGTASSLESVIGAETGASGEISMELHGSGTAATPTPESDPLWECAFGVKTAKTGSTYVSAATSSTSFTLFSGTGFAVGDAITVLVGGTSLEVTWIVAGSGVPGTGVVVCSPALSATPTVTTSLVKNIGVKYTLSSANTKSFWLSHWLGNAERRNVPGCKVNKLSMDFSTGKIVSAKFGYEAQKTNTLIAESCSFLGSANYDIAPPLVATNMIVKLGGVTYEVSDVKFEMGLPMFKKQAVTGSGISSIVRSGKRTVSGSFSLMFENSTVETALRNGTKAELVLVCNGGLGNIFAIRFPQIKYLKAPISATDGLYKYEVSFMAAMEIVSSTPVAESEITCAAFM